MENAFEYVYKMRVIDRLSCRHENVDLPVHLLLADLIFENSRVYLRRTELGYLFVLMDAFAQTALVRLNCDILAPSLKEMKGGKGLRRLFKKKG